TDADRTHRQIQHVVNYDQVGFRPKLMLLQQALHRSTAQVHKRFWLSQKNLLGTDLRARSKRLALPISDFHVQIAGQTIDREESQIVRRELIFDTRIAETDNELHALLISPCRTSRVMLDWTGGDARPPSNNLFFLFLLRLFWLLGSSRFCAFFALH